MFHRISIELPLFELILSKSLKKFSFFDEPVKKYGSWLDAVWENVAKLTTSYLATRWRTYQQLAVQQCSRGGKNFNSDFYSKKSELTLHLFSLFFYGLAWQVSTRAGLL